MPTYSFKSVGQTGSERRDSELAITATPIGIKTPVRPGGKDGLFALNYNLADQQQDNLRNLLLTNWGERLGIYDFGGNLRPLLADFVSLDDFDSKAFTRIKSAVDRWMPFVQLDSYSSEVDRKENANGLAAIRITITYDIPALKVTGRVLQLILYVM